MVFDNPVRSLPASWYHDREIFLQEQQKIFSRNWIFAGLESQLSEPGQFVACNIAGHSVVVVRNEQGKLAGFLNLCRHRASPLCTAESGRLHQFTCPYHSWSYNLEGSLLSAPGFEGIDNSEFSLHPVRVDTWQGLVFASLDSEIEPLETWLGDITGIAAGFPGVPEMEYECVRRNDCPANWKNYSDNSAEGYHLGSIHRDLARSMVRDQTRIAAINKGKFVGFDVTYRAEKEDSPGFWIYKFPGLLMHFSTNSFNIERVIPLDERRSRMERWFWFKPEVSLADRNETIEFSNQVMQEDMDICARVQLNLEGGIHDTGVLSPSREPGTIFFQQCVREALNAE